MNNPLPEWWPQDYEGAAMETYERVMKTLIRDTQALAGDVPAWVEQWSDSIGAAITLAFALGAKWRDRYPNEDMEVGDAEP